LYNKNFKEQQGGRIGVVVSGDYFEPWDSADARDYEAAERRMDFWHGWFADPMV
jgi:beta-glucosidase